MHVSRLPIVLRNVTLVAWNRLAKAGRIAHKQTRRGVKQLQESTKQVSAQLRSGRQRGRAAAHQVYAGGVRTTRVWTRLGSQTRHAMLLEWSVRRELRRAARGSGPVIVGPWLSEVGYEALYWVPFVRWFADHYHVDPARLVVVSRGGVASWYGDIASRYVDLLDLFPPEEFAARNAARQASGDQKQLAVGSFDDEILTRVRAALGIPGAGVCHPSAMFRLLRHFWLGTASLQHVFDHTRYSLVSSPTHVALPGLPDAFVAVKFYSGRALPDTPANRQALRQLVERLASDLPVVVLETGLTLDEHADYVFDGLANVTTIGRWLTPSNNLAVQTEVIRRAARFVGTCGSLAWLAPMLGTETFAVYTDEHFLTPHLYAARQIYPRMSAAPFTPVDLRFMAGLGVDAPVPARVPV